MVRFVNSFCCSRQPDNFQVPVVGRAFIALAILEAGLLSALSVGLWVVHDPTSPAGPLYAALGLLCTLTCVVFGTDAVVSENAFQFASFHVLQAALTSFIVLQTFRDDAALGPLWVAVRLPTLAIKATFQVAFVALSPFVLRAFGFYAYKVVGGSVPLIAMFHRRRAVLSAMHLDTALSLLLFLLTKAYLLPDGDPNLPLALAALGSTLLFTALLRSGVVTENRLVTGACLALLAPLQPAFVAYALWWLWAKHNELPPSVTYPQFAILGLASILLRALLTGLAVYTRRHDFGEGLVGVISLVDAQTSVLPCVAWGRDRGVCRACCGVGRGAGAGKGPRGGGSLPHAAVHRWTTLLGSHDPSGAVGSNLSAVSEAHAETLVSVVAEEVQRAVRTGGGKEGRSGASTLLTQPLIDDRGGMDEEEEAGAWAQRTAGAAAAATATPGRRSRIAK